MTRLDEIEERLAAVGRTAVGTKDFVVHAPSDLAALVEVVKAVQETRTWLHRLGFMRVEPSTGDVRRRLDAALSRLEDS